jgi:hypothetical protein
VVRVDGDAGASVAVKHPLGARATRTLEQEREVLRRLAGDERAGAARRLLPSQVACQLDAPLPLVAETWLPGIDAGTALRRDPAAARRITAASLAAIGELHAATGRRECAAAHAAAWVDDRVAVLMREIGWCRTAAGTAGLEGLRQRLHQGLSDRRMTVGWTHGDFAAGNVLLTGDGLAGDSLTGNGLTGDGDGPAVSGVIDWSTACPDGPVDVDAYTLVLTMRYELSGEPLGRVIADIVRAGRLAATEREVLDAAADPDAVSLALLTWLWHVSNNAAKSARYGRSTRWVSANVVPVLEVVRP